MTRSSAARKIQTAPSAGFLKASLRRWGVKRPIGIFKRIDKSGNKGFRTLLWHNHSQDLDLRLLPHPLDIVRKPGVSREAKIVVSGDLTVERPVIDPFELQMINRVNLVAEASQGNQQRLTHVLV